MNAVHNTWVVVLAAGDGTRLSTLTTDLNGNAVPKQYCSLNGGASLLHEALLRAHRVVPRERICAIVADQHRRYWHKALWALPSDNIIVQPRNRGTANGVLLSVLTILEPEEADPELGYIVPAGKLSDGSCAVARFVEKPAPALARELLSTGALWNSFIFAASAPSLLGLLRRTMPTAVDQMATALAREERSAARSSPAFINLAAQHARLGLSN